MDNRTTILNELKEISPVVAQIGFNTPYGVPAGYFEGLAGQVLARVKEEEGSAVLVSKDNPYSVPQDYFEHFATNLLQRIKAGEASTAKEELEALSPLLSRLNKKMPFSTPAGFFDELTDNAVAGAKAIDFVNVELENLSPMMSSLKSKQSYQIPAGYFEQLPEQVLQKAKSQPAKVVSMNFARKAIRYAAAAVVAGLIITAAWLYFGTGNKATDTDPALAGIEQVSDEMLESYLENQLTTETTVLASNDDDIDADDLKDMLADVSDDELQKYIDQYGSKDILTN